MVDRRRQQEERDRFLGHLMLSQAAAKAWLNIYSSVRGRTKRELLTRRAVSVTREYFSLSCELGPFRLSLAWVRSEGIRGAAKGWKPSCGTANKNGGQKILPAVRGPGAWPGLLCTLGYLPELEVVAGCD